MSLKHNASFFITFASNAHHLGLEGEAPRVFNTWENTAKDAWKRLEQFNYLDKTTTCTVYSCTVCTHINEVYFVRVEFTELMRLAKAEIEAEATALKEKISEIDNKLQVAQS